MLSLEAKRVSDKSQYFIREHDDRHGKYPILTSNDIEARFSVSVYLMNIVFSYKTRQCTHRFQNKKSRKTILATNKESSIYL